MLTYTTLPVGYLQTNCYIISGSEGCLVIDPGDEPDMILKAIGNQKLLAILLTHGHFDHVGAVRDLAAETDCRVFLCEADLALPRSMTSGPLFHTDTYTDGDEITLNGLTFTVLHTPGHTPGSVCLCFEHVMFSGDTLFAGSIGRTDFPGSDHAQMVQSLKRLTALDTNYTVCPGHGESTTLEQEKRYNPFMKSI